VIGRLAIGKARLKSVRIEDLTVDRVKVIEALNAPERKEIGANGLVP
jgi:hypothetical protein